MDTESGMKIYFLNINELLGYQCVLIVYRYKVLNFWKIKFWCIIKLRKYTLSIVLEILLYQINKLIVGHEMFGYLSLMI